MKTVEQDHAKEQAQAQLASIREMVEALHIAEATDNDESREGAEQTIREDALSVLVRDDWRNAGSDKGKDGPVEFEILLCTGGPACRIRGRLDEHGEPETARIEYQDWGTPWTEYPLHEIDERADVLTYCRVFYFGE